MPINDPSGLPLAATTAPRIETERLVLRAHEITDYAACVELWTDPAVTRFVGGKPFSPSQIWSKLLCYAGLWSLLHYGYWAIEEKTSRRLIGELGFADFKRGMQPSLDGMLEFGWALISHAQGRGYAIEAARAALNWADTRFAAQATTCIIGPANNASLRLATKLDYQEVARSTYAGNAVIVFRRTARSNAAAERNGS